MPYALSAVAAVIYIVATSALATDRRRLALVAVGIELVGVLVVGVDQPAAARRTTPTRPCGRDFGAGYGYVPLVLPFVGLWWLLRGSRTDCCPT